MQMYNNIQDQARIYGAWKQLVEANGDIKDETLRMTTAVILENTQREADRQYKINNGRGLITEDILGVNTAFGPGAGTGHSIANTAGASGDARVPSVVIPMIRRIFPALIAHKLVGVQAMQGPIGMAFAFRAKYGNNRNGVEGSTSGAGTEIGFNSIYADFTGKKQTVNKYGLAEDQGQYDMSSAYVSGGIDAISGDPQKITPSSSLAATAWKSFYGNGAYMNMTRANDCMVGDGADTGVAENWAVGKTMPEAGFDLLKETVTAKTRKLGVQISREVEEDMKAMQGINAQTEVSNIISYEIAQEIDRQLLAEIVQSAIRVGNVSTWDPALADGRNQVERANTLYTTILTKSAQIAVQTRRGAANWCVCSPAAAALLESQIYNPLGVAGGLGNANAYGKGIDENVSVVEIGSLRNGTIKLYRDSLAGGDYILLGFKGNNIYDTGIIYLPYIPLELMHSINPFTMNPITAARTRYGVTTNLFGAGQYYSYIALPELAKTVSDGKQFVQF